MARHIGVALGLKRGNTNSKLVDPTGHVLEPLHIGGLALGAAHGHRHTSPQIVTDSNNSRNMRKKAVASAGQDSVCQ
jgi:hypothetical protein